MCESYTMRIEFRLFSRCLLRKRKIKKGNPNDLIDQLGVDTYG